MQLLELTQRLGRETGLQPAIAVQKTVLVELINDAAQELYEQTDLPNSLMEQTVQASSESNSQQVTLPGHIYEVRGIRDYTRAMTIHDMRPRYHNYPWPTGDMYTFRLIGESPIGTSLDNETVLTMDPVADEVTVTLSGSTTEAAQISGQFDKNGSGTAETINWTALQSITKDIYTTQDIILRNADDVEVSRILNYLMAARYLQIELLERPQTSLSPAILQPGRVLDILYKPHFRPLRLDTDTFQVQGFDIPLIYKAVEIYRIRGIDENQTENKVLAAKAHAARSDERFSEVLRSRVQPVEIQVQFGQPRGDTSLLRGLRRFKYGRHDY